MPKRTIEEDARFDAWWEREGKHHNPFDLRNAFRAGRADATLPPCGCRTGECESKAGKQCRIADEIKHHGAQ